jgi:pimeloyl-ACP methyl ester carboxylesterase
MRSLKLALAVALGLGGMTRTVAQPAGTPLSPAASAEQWLGLVDQGRDAESWDQGSASLKSRVDRARFAGAIEAARKPLGAVVSRKLMSESARRPPPGMADGFYEMLEFDTDFAGSRGVTETVIMMHESSGWKVNGYGVQKADPLYHAYEEPGILANIPGGPTIHVKCMGTGAPTVVLTAGSGDWSAGWHTIQPEIAKTTRVCAWDRPGFGFSSGSTQPQTVLNTTADLEVALRIAHVEGPYIAVGHSLGSYESLLLKDRNPKAVVGMVLVDPSIPDQTRRFREAAPEVGKFYEAIMAGEDERLGRCIGEARSGALKPGGQDPDGCLFSPSFYPSELRRGLATRNTDPLRPTAVKSWNENIIQDGSLVVNSARNYGDMPLIVLTATKDLGLPGMPQSAKDELPAERAAWVRGHDELAALSSRGVNRLVPDSTHYIQYDQPKVVIEAIEEVIRAVRPKVGAGTAAARH